MDTSSVEWVRLLGDKLALYELVSRFGFVVDSGDYRGLYLLLSENVTMEVDGDTVISGVEKFVAMGAEPVWGFTQHFYTNILSNVSGDAATVYANLAAIHVREGSSRDHFDFGARYKFEAIRAADHGWRLSRIVIEKIWESGNDQAMFD